MIKRILVATDGSDAAQPAIEYALSLGHSLNAKLTGVFVVDVKLLEGPFLRDLSATMGTAPMANYQMIIAGILEERGKATLAAFEAACKTAGVECETVLSTGVVHHTILEQAELADLVVLGRGGEHSDWLEGLMGSTAEAVVRRAKLPVVVTASTRSITDGILVAFDGSTHARQALKVAVDLAHDTGARLELIVVGGDDSASVVQDAEAYLADHGIPAKLEKRSGVAASEIVEYAQEAGVGLLVMGAYGHSRVRELLVGSTTTSVINHAGCPVLLCR